MSLRFGTSAALLTLLFSPGADATYAQALHGGCYLREGNVCQIEVDPFTIPVDGPGGERVAQFRLYANRTDAPAGSQLLWEFSSASSYSYKPSGSFSPSLPQSGLVAVCGATYYLSILTRGDTSTTTGSFGVGGVSASFTCPAAAPVGDPSIFADGFED